MKHTYPQKAPFNLSPECNLVFQAEKYFPLHAASYLLFGCSAIYNFGSRNFAMQSNNIG